MTAARRTTAAIILLALSRGALAAAAEPPPVFQGSWIVTAGGAVLHGRWSAQALPGQPDDVQGSWSMVNDAGDVTAQGTWSARRARRGFEGKWSARAASGGIFKGSFEAHLPDFKGKTLQDMFAETATKQISGFWRMGGARGAWYLKGNSLAIAPITPANGTMGTQIRSGLSGRFARAAHLRPSTRPGGSHQLAPVGTGQTEPPPSAIAGIDCVVPRGDMAAPRRRLSGPVSV